MNIVYGLYQPDEGEVRVDGTPVWADSPRKAMELGIGMVHQHFMLIPTLSILENIILGSQAEHPPLLDLKNRAPQIDALCREMGLGVPITEKVGRITLSQQQKLEIIKALSRGARILVLDEPTAVLTPQETVELFTLLRRLRDHGTTIVFISHKLNEVMEISDRVTVMRLGKVVQTLDTAETTPLDLAELMVGRSVALRVEKQPATAGDVRLRVETVYARRDSSQPALRGLSLDLRAGEIRGLAGVDGNGQSELVEVIMGLIAPEQGSIVFQDRDITALDVAGRSALGLAHVPENRHVQGLILDMTVAENLLLDVFDREPYAHRGWMHFDVIADRARELMRTFDVRAPGPETRARSLSGGNQQKTVLARAIARSPSVLVVAQPTRGLDVGAISFVHGEIVEARDRGCAVLLISSDLDELLALSDTISVIYEGQILETMSVGQVDPIQLGLLMAGTRVETPNRGAQYATAEIVT
jgi:simple sugar transport system ATP-binding protein